MKKMGERDASAVVDKRVNINGGRLYVDDTKLGIARQQERGKGKSSVSCASSTYFLFHRWSFLRAPSVDASISSAPCKVGITDPGIMGS